MLFGLDMAVRASHIGLIGLSWRPLVLLRFGALLGGIGAIFGVSWAVLGALLSSYVST